MEERDYYEVLQLHPSADHAMMVQAYWHLARKYKIAMDRDAFAEHALEELNRAFGVLGSPELRAQIRQDTSPRHRDYYDAPKPETKRVSIEVCFWNLPAWQGMLAATCAVALAAVALAAGARPLLVFCLAAATIVAALLVLPRATFSGRRNTDSTALEAGGERGRAGEVDIADSRTLAGARTPNTTSYAARSSYRRAAQVPPSFLRRPPHRAPTCGPLLPVKHDRTMVVMYSGNLGAASARQPSRKPRRRPIIIREQGSRRGARQRQTLRKAGAQSNGPIVSSGRMQIRRPCYRRHSSCYAEYRRRHGAGEQRRGSNRTRVRSQCRRGNGWEKTRRADEGTKSASGGPAASHRRRRGNRTETGATSSRIEVALPEQRESPSSSRSSSGHRPATPSFRRRPIERLELALILLVALYTVLMGALAGRTNVRLERSYSEHLERLSESLRHLAYHDSLTGLFNHRYFHDHLRSEFERARRYGHQLSVVMLDVNHFKEVNDHYGHLTGDELLSFLGRLIARERALQRHRGALRRR